MRKQRPGCWFWVDDRIILAMADMGPVAFAVYCVLAKHAGRRTQETWLAASTIARYVGRSERTVRRQLRLLEQAGLIASRERYGPAGQLANGYTLSEPPESPRSPMSGAPGHQCPGPPVTGDHRTRGWEPEVENQPPYDPPEGDFLDRFLAAYPRTDRPGYTRRALDRALAGGADPELIIARAQLFAASDEGRADDCPPASQWIRGERYLEDPASWARRPKDHEHRARETRRIIDALPKRDGTGLPDDWRRQLMGA